MWEEPRSELFEGGGGGRKEETKPRSFYSQFRLRRKKKRGRRGKKRKFFSFSLSLSPFCFSNHGGIGRSFDDAPASPARDRRERKRQQSQRCSRQGLQHLAAQFVVSGFRSPASGGALARVSRGRGARRGGPLARCGAPAAGRRHPREGPGRRQRRVGLRPAAARSGDDVDVGDGGDGRSRRRRRQQRRRETEARVVLRCCCCLWPRGR
jgi:hypothetical protein